MNQRPAPDQASQDTALAAAGILIRAASPADGELLHAFLEPYVKQRMLLRRSVEELSELTKHGFLAEADGHCIGFAAIEIYSRKLAEVQCLAVLEAYRARGIGRELVLRCIDRARQLGVMEVMAISSSDHFLRGCGFDYSLPDQKRALFCQLRPRHEDY